MEDTSVPILVAVIAGVSAVIGSLINNLFQKRGRQSESYEHEADAAKTLVETAIELIPILEDRIDKLNQRIATQEAGQKLTENAIEELNGKHLRLRLGFSIIIAQMRKENITPVIDLETIERMSNGELNSLARDMGVTYGK